MTTRRENLRPLAQSISFANVVKVRDAAARLYSDGAISLDMFDSFLEEFKSTAERYEDDPFAIAVLCGDALDYLAPYTRKAVRS